MKLVSIMIAAILTSSSSCALATSALANVIKQNLATPQHLILKTNDLSLVYGGRDLTLGGYHPETKHIEQPEGIA